MQVDLNALTFYLYMQLHFKDVNAILGHTDRAMVPGSPPLLCGKVSRDIKQELDKLTSDARVKKLRWFSDCFSVTTLMLLNRMKLYL